MHRWVLAGLAIAVCGVARAADPPPTPPVVSRAAQCLADHVERVVANDPDVTSAADFLMTYACAAEVSAAAKYERNLIAAAHFNKLNEINPYGLVESCHDPCPPPAPLKMTVDPDTGELIPPKTPAGPQSDALTREMADMTGDFASVYGDATPIELKTLVGQLVLAAHERRFPAHQP